jgi:hypothetical protein
MARIRALIVKAFVVLSIVLGRVPRIVVLLDLFHQPSVARVLLTRRRTPAYSEFFTLRDREGRRAAPITHMATADMNHNHSQSTAHAYDQYIPVHTA